MTTRHDDIYAEVRSERERQQADGWTLTHDDGHSAMEWNAILAVQLGKTHSNALDALAFQHLNSPSLAAEWGRTWRARMVKLAAVAVAAIEAYDRTTARGEAAKEA